MPLYDYRCVACGTVQDAYRKFSEYDNGPTCRCGAKTERVISAPAMVMNDIGPYRSMIDGSIITSRSQHRAHLREHGCIEVGNEKMVPKKREPPPGLKQDLIAAYQRARK